MFRFMQEPSSGSYSQCLAVQRGTSLHSEPYTRMHTRSEYAAITLTASATTHTVEQDL